MSYENTFKRKELKYLLTPQNLQAVQQAMEGHMQADAYGRTSIRNLYCDSPDFLLLRRSLERPDYKEKVRLRSYGAPTPEDTVFLELKKKHDGVVYKRRQPLRLRDAMAYLQHGVYPRPDTQVLRELNYTLRTWHLAPRVYVEYDRIAYYGIEDMEFRMTFDFNIQSRWKDLTLNGNTPCVPLFDRPYALMEVKAANAMPRWLVDVLSERHIYPTSFSKVGRIYQQMLRQKNLSVQMHGQNAGRVAANGNAAHGPAEHLTGKREKESLSCLKVS